MKQILYFRIALNHKMAHSDFTEGPLTMLTESMRDNKKVVIEIGNQYHGSSGKLIANIVAYDKDFNMVLRNMIEVWSKKCIRTGKLVPRERFVAKMFLPCKNVRIVAKI